MTRHTDRVRDLKAGPPMSEAIEALKRLALSIGPYLTRYAALVADADIRLVLASLAALQARVEEQANALDDALRMIKQYAPNGIEVSPHRASLAALAQQTPEGWVLAPPRATPKMIEAAVLGVVRENGGLEWNIAAGYRAMIAARPAPPEPKP
jgi:hypothetical protein